MVAGDLHLHDFESEILGSARRVAVWLPPLYARDDVSRFPVLYLHDGQNMFDRSTAFREEWQVGDTAAALIEQGEIEPLIAVGVYNAGEARVDEYTLSVDPEHGRGGGVGIHGRMLVEELKPWIDSTYRTLPSAASTGIGGSSLGALASLHLALRYPTAFSKVAVHSPSVWWHDRAIIKQVDALPNPLQLRIWLDVGTAEGPEAVPDARALRDALVRKGWRVGPDLSYLEVKDAAHDERAWAARVPPMLRYLFPA
jgi:predicted alpha/beta superfamily hydrolase